MLIRACNYLENYGVYPIVSEITVEVDMPITTNHVQFDLQRVIFDDARGHLSLQALPRGDQWDVTVLDEHHCSLKVALAPGYHLFWMDGRGERCAMPIIFQNRTRPAEVAVIRPIFTIWSYHWAGFYFNESDFTETGFPGRNSSLARACRLAKRVFRRSAHRLGIRADTMGQKSFPAQGTIHLDQYYRRNNRWDKSIWDGEWGNMEGLWCDEVLSGMPVFALLDKHRVPYHVFTDVDLHAQNKALSDYRVLIFSGQEGMTLSYYQMLERLQKKGMTSFLLWGVQGFGYRQLSYDAKTGELRYECTRGRKGLWGDTLEERQPDWEDEAKLFGFHFPEPPSGDWRQKALFSRIGVFPSNHPIVRSSNTSGNSYSYRLQDAQANPKPGLTWAGGEIQRRVAPDAIVLAHLDGEEDLIGIGEYRNAVIFAPTYLPAFFAFQAQSHPEVESWFMAALEYLLGRSAPCESV